MKEKEKNEKAITLIVLIITVIVLLILAGVTITNLTADKGVIKEARNAKELAELASLEEQIDLAIVRAEQKNENADLDDVIEQLIEHKVISKPEQILDQGEIETDLGYIIKGKLNDYLAKLKFDANTLAIGTAINSDKYGWKVKNYKVTTDEYTAGIWRLFFQDSNYTYLITDEDIGSYDSLEYMDTYRNTPVGTVGCKLNAMVSPSFEESQKKLGSTIPIVAWLTDTEAWKAYGNYDAVFAIGAPTIELFMASYNSTGKDNTLEISITSEGGYYYNSRYNWFKEEDNHGIYRQALSDTWWVASPFNYAQEIVVDKGNGNFSHVYAGDSGNIRPIVCIPTSVFQSKYASSLADE